jgi:hypothetical protein
VWRAQRQGLFDVLPLRGLYLSKHRSHLLGADTGERQL